MIDFGRRDCGLLAHFCPLSEIAEWESDDKAIADNGFDKFCAGYSDFLVHMENAWTYMATDDTYMHIISKRFLS